MSSAAGERLLPGSRLPSGLIIETGSQLATVLNHAQVA